MRLSSIDNTNSKTISPINQGTLLLHKNIGDPYKASISKHASGSKNHGIKKTISQGNLHKESTLARGGYNMVNNMEKYNKQQAASTGINGNQYKMLNNNQITYCIRKYSK